MLNLSKRNKDKDNKLDTPNVEMSQELEQSLDSQEMTPTKDFLISLSKVVGIVVLVVILFLLGRWIWQDNGDNDIKPIVDNTQVSQVDEVKEPTDAGTITPVVEDKPQEEVVVDDDEPVVVIEDPIEEVPTVGIDQNNLAVMIFSLMVIAGGAAYWHKLVYDFAKSRK